MTDLPVSSDRDEESEKKTELGAENLKERLISETQEYDRIYTEARGIVGNILVVVGIILAAGTTFLINKASELSILWLTGVSLLNASIIFVFLIVNHKRLIMGINPKYVNNDLTIYITHGHGELLVWDRCSLEHFPNAKAFVTPDVVKVMRLRASPINSPFAGVIRRTNCLIPVIVFGAVTGFIVSKAVLHRFPMILSDGVA